MELHLAHEFTLNPDGSGKVAVRWDGPGGDGAPSPEALLRSEIEEARGVDTWHEVSCAPEGERLVFAGTAYFRDLSALRFHCQGFHLNLLDLEVTQDQGECVVATRAGAVQVGAATVPADLDAASLAARLAEEREKLQGARGFLEGMFGGVRCTVVLRLPGRLGDSASGKRIGDNALRAEFAGRDLLALVDRLLADDQLLGTLARQGGANPETLMALLGDKGPIRVRTRGGCRPQFDYAAEVAAATAAFAAQRADLGLPEPPAQGAPLRHVRVAAVKIVHEADAEHEVHPMGQNYTGVSMALLGELAEPVLSVEEGQVTALIAADGRNLTPDDEWKRRIHFPKLSSDRTRVLLEVEIPATTPAITGMAAIRGTLTVRATSGTDAVDLGFPQLCEGAEGTALGARLTRVDDPGDESMLEVFLQVPRAMVQGLDLVAGGETRELQCQSYSASGDECTLGYPVPGGVPADGRLVLRVAGNLHVEIVPFELGPVDLLGRPQ